MNEGRGTKKEGRKEGIMKEREEDQKD